MLLRNTLRRLAFTFHESKARSYLSRRLGDSRLSWLLPVMRRAMLHVKFMGAEGLALSDAELSRLNHMDSLVALFPASHTANVARDSMQYPRISIVTPNYNQGRFLEECIKSVISQDYPNLEFIITDGGSTDNSVEIIERYADKLTWWVSEKDHGQADAINKGLNRATGQIFNWLNADDRLAPGALLSCAESFQAHPDAVGWVGGCVRTDEYGSIAGIIYPNGVDREHIGENWNGRQFYQPSCFLATERVKAVGGLNPDLYIALDLDLWIRMLEGRKLAVGQGIWSIALNHDEAKTQKSIETMVHETADLQEAHGFVDGARARRAAARGKPLRYVMPASLRKQMAERPQASRSGSEPLISMEGRRHLCFVGDFELREDIEAVRFFLTEIFPIILRKDWLEFHIIGRRARSCGQRFRAPDLRCHEEETALPRLLAQCKLFVSPMTRRGGRAGKLVVAASAGLPIVTTPAGCEDLELEDGEDCFVADHPLEFAEKCHQVLNDPICWHRFSARSTLLSRACPEPLSISR